MCKIGRTNFLFSSIFYTISKISSEVAIRSDSLILRSWFIRLDFIR